MLPKETQENREQRFVKGKDSAKSNRGFCSFRFSFLKKKKKALITLGFIKLIL